MTIKRLIFMALVLMLPVALLAQNAVQIDETKAAEYRQLINLDYSMPDFNTTKVDGKVIGERLAKMLQILARDTNPYSTNLNYLGSIQAEQMEELQYVKIESYKIKSISKRGDVITILMQTKLQHNAKNIKKAELKLVFDKGVSDCQKANELFATLGRYVQEYYSHSYERNCTCRWIRNSPLSHNKGCEQAVAPYIRQTDGVLSHQCIDAGRN